MARVSWEGAEDTHLVYRVGREGIPELLQGFGRKPSAGSLNTEDAPAVREFEISGVADARDLHRPSFCRKTPPGLSIPPNRFRNPAHEPQSASGIEPAGVACAAPALFKRQDRTIRLNSDHGKDVGSANGNLTYL